MATYIKWVISIIKCHSIRRIIYVFEIGGGVIS